jgi:Domain of unknown function (DUF6475)
MMKNKTEFLKYMTALSEIKNKPLSQLTIEMYWQTLQEYSDELCIMAFTRAIKEIKFFPQPCELIDFITGADDISLITMKAWTAVVEAVKSIGNYRSVQFDEPAIHSCIEVMGGWEYFCNATNEEWKWKRIEFEKLFPVMLKKGNHLPYLQGITEQDQRLKNYENLIEKPVFIKTGINPDEKALKFPSKPTQICEINKNQ